MTNPGDITIWPLTPADWPVIEALFGANGAFGGCWCMWWRVDRGGKIWDAAKGEPNRRRFQALVQEGAVHGMLAFADGVPVGWCNFGPRSEFPRLARARTLQRPTAAARWSITCFYIRPKWRRRGLAGRLLAAATAEAFRLGAAEIEGYPVPARSAAAPGPFVWTGVPALFAAAGYAEADRSTGADRGAGARPIYIRRPGS